MKTITKTNGEQFSFNPDTQYLLCKTVSNELTKVGDIILSHDAVFEVIEKHASDKPNERTGLIVYWHRVKRIDSKPWDYYFSDILNDNFSFQGNKRANVALFTGVIKDKSL